MTLASLHVQFLLRDHVSSHLFRGDTIFENELQTNKSDFHDRWYHFIKNILYIESDVLRLILFLILNREIYRTIRLFITGFTIYPRHLLSWMFIGKQPGISLHFHDEPLELSISPVNSIPKSKRYQYEFILQFFFGNIRIDVVSCQ